MSEKNEKFPSQPIANPKANGKETAYQLDSTSGQPQYQGEIKSVTTLRSGRKIENHVEPPKSSTKVSSPSPVLENSTSEPVQDQSDKSVSKEPSIPKPIESQPFVPRAPYPVRLVQCQKQPMFDEIKEVFKNVHINIPFLMAIQQIPSYAKFLKDLCTVKRKTQVPRDVFSAEQTSSFVQQGGVVKYKDPGRLIVLCKLGENYFGNGLLDLGSSVNVLPYYLYKELELERFETC